MRQPSLTLRQLPRFGRFLLARFSADGGPQSAAALTYMSLFALVPLLTVIYSALSIVPALQGFESQIEEWIYARFLPSFGSEISGYLSDFSAQARSLSGLGGLFLLVTAYLLLVNIEANFNRLWGCPARPRGVATLIHYWAILTLGPLLLGGALALRAYLLSLQLFSLSGALGELSELLVGQLPRLLGWAAMTLIYALVPNQAVSWRHAAIGAVFTVLVLELAKQLFTQLMGQTIYAAVYGAFAAVPLFLIWVYLVWVIVLFGAELVWALGSFDRRDTAADWSPAAVRLWLLYSGWQAGQSGAARLASEPPAGVSMAQLQSARSWLVGGGYAVQTSAGDYLLSCPLHSVTMAQLVDSTPLAAHGAVPPTAADDGGWSVALGRAQQLLDAADSQVAAASLESLFGGAGEPAGGRRDNGQERQ